MAFDIVADRVLTVAQFADILLRSSLAERRPVNDHGRLADMLRHANLLLTAWDGEKLVGVSRCATDFAYFCYCSDLAVDKAYQGHGLGTRLLKATRAMIHPKATLYLISAPAALGFYERIGLTRIDRCFAMAPAS